ncbi:type II toxin-antitoxin system VapC family toxin [Azospirillum sp. YIM B02556]|uniref:Ribonuclease VapC n=1 Tax=Azospirillum endophyticum TaxID=2800326 RepID=A0ABS1F4L9_9PROT|nr:type II toxin-antitoxin system VapC family toxin [Azospirillum endophyticum]MBK1838336.1 type II toxin-antitoxin system VapC family toxin [Azospirillum endophyticum]
MVVDISALVAILKAEPEAATFLVKLATATVCRLSAANFVEAGLIANRDSTGAYREALEDLLKEFDIRIEPVREYQARLALDAFRRYSKRTGHPASLNYGDCFAYALAADTGEVLLFKGNDFPCTDLVPA